MFTVVINSPEEIPSSKPKVKVIYCGNRIYLKEFKGNSKIREFIVPDSIDSIESSAFEACKNLTTINIPANLKKMGTYVFADCFNLDNISFPPDSNMLTISEGTFFNCKKLKKVSLSDNIKQIYYCAFADCSNLTTINIPTSLISIGNESFKNCKKLNNITLPSTLEDINGGAFYGCINLTKISIPVKTKVIKIYSFYNCRNLKTVIFGSTKTNIHESTFTRCPNMKVEITFSKTANSMNNYNYLNYDVINIIPDLREEYKSQIHYILSIADDNTIVKWSPVEFTLRALNGDIVNVNLSENLKSPTDSNINIMEELVISCARFMGILSQSIFIVQKEIIIYHPYISISVEARDDNNTIIFQYQKDVLTEKGFEEEEIQENTIYDILLQLENIDPYNTLIFVNGEPVENDWNLEKAGISEGTKIVLMISSDEEE